MSEPDPADMAKAVDEYRPNRKSQIEHLHSWRPMIEGLRKKRASLSTIAEILRQRGVQTNREYVRRFWLKYGDGFGASKSTRMPRRMARVRKTKTQEPPPAVLEQSVPTQPELIPASPRPGRRGPRIAQIKLLPDNKP